tara:strand:+ start:327 stop:1760 length:1434 start_codon:yes stop_codon:yes gene_type:complete
MTFNIIGSILPEVTIAIAICIVILVNSLVRNASVTLIHSLVLFFLSLSLFLSFVSLELPDSNIFDGHYVIDAFGTNLKIIALIAAILVHLASFKSKQNIKNEIFLIQLFATLGVMILCSAHNLLTVYLGLETLTLSMYGIVASNRNSIEATESAMKFFILGAIASAIFLYGVSILYGVTGTLSLDLIKQSNLLDTLEMKIAVAFMACGIIFKFGAFPFHSWVPDSYQGSNTTAAIYISSVPKIGAFALIARLFLNSLNAMSDFWSILILLAGLLSIIIGNLIALAQMNLRRMLAYSAIGHIGFVLLSFSIVNANGITASMTYLIMYLIMTIAAFALIESIATQDNQHIELSDLKGLSKSHPLVAFMLLFCMFSMVGIPPFIGFYAKWIVLSELVNNGMIWFALIGITMSVIAAYYYLRVVWYMYFENSDQLIGNKGIINTQSITSITVSITLLLIGLYPNPIIEYTRSIISSFLLID